MFGGEAALIEPHNEGPGKGATLEMLFPLKAFILHMRVVSITSSHAVTADSPPRFLHESHEKASLRFPPNRSGLKVPRPIYSTKHVQRPGNRSPFLITTFVVRHSFEFSFFEA